MELNRGQLLEMSNTCLQAQAAMEKEGKAALEAKAFGFFKQEAEKAGRLPPKSVTVPMLKTRLGVKNGHKPELVKKLL